MRVRFIGRALALVAVVASASGEARRHGGHHTYHYARHTYSSAGYGSAYYTARSGHQVYRPMLADRRPSGASARCRDSSWSFSESHRGTCSHHGGVAEWLD